MGFDSAGSQNSPLYIKKRIAANTQYWRYMITSQPVVVSYRCKPYNTTAGVQQYERA